MDLERWLLWTSSLLTAVGSTVSFDQGITCIEVAMDGMRNEGLVKTSVAAAGTSAGTSLAGGSFRQER